MFQLVDQPHLFPGRSLLGNTGPCVDTAVEIPVGGRVYVDRVEAGEIARLFGFLTPEAASQLKAQLAAAEGRAGEAERRLAAVRDQVAVAAG